MFHVKTIASNYSNLSSLSDYTFSSFINLYLCLCVTTQIPRLGLSLCLLDTSQCPFLILIFLSSSYRSIHGIWLCFRICHANHMASNASTLSILNDDTLPSFINFYYCLIFATQMKILGSSLCLLGTSLRTFWIKNWFSSSFSSMHGINLCFCICHVNHMAYNTFSFLLLSDYFFDFLHKFVLISLCYYPNAKTWILIVLLRHFTVALLNFELLQLFLALYTWHKILFLYLLCEFYGFQWFYFVLN